MNTWNDIEHGFGPARATQYTTSDTDRLAATLYNLFHGRYVKSDNGHVITLSDGTSLTIALADGNMSENAVAYNRGVMCAHADRRIIERAHLQASTNHAGTITGVSLILFYQGETMPATIRTAYADITTGTFATVRDKSKPLATIRVALAQKQIDAWVKREQQALADMLVGETITGAQDGIFTLSPREADNNDRNSETIRNSDNEDTREAGATNARDAHTITVHATLNNQPRNNKGSRHATTITLTGGNTITIRHETRTYDIFGETRTKKTGTGGGLTLRARDAIENGQTITAAWVEKTETYREPSDYDDEEETIETISLYAMFDGDLRPTLLTNNTTRYSWKAEHPDFTIKRGSVSVTADSARISSSFHRPWKE